MEGRLPYKDFHFMDGFVTWPGTDLQQEVIDGKWWVMDVSLEELLNGPDRLWGELLIRDNHVYGMLEKFPDPSMN